MTLRDAVAAAQRADTDLATGKADALRGVPLVVKDDVQVAGMPNTAGTKVGLSLDGPRGGDERLLELGMAIEKVRGRTPPPRR